MIAWLSAFLFTQAVEVPIYAYALRGRSRPVAFALAFGASLLTHPFVWFASPYLPYSYWTRVAIAEVGAWLGEALWLRAFGAPRPLLWSLTANGASLALGLASRAVFHWP